MEIILPPHKLISKEVTLPCPELIDDIEGMKELLKINDFNGRDGYAIAHCQVSKNPYRFFVAKAGLLPLTVIINPIITYSENPYIAKEGCLSFPDKPMVEVMRHKKIKVSFQTMNMQSERRTLSGIPAQIFQHEIEHFEGKNIYGV